MRNLVLTALGLGLAVAAQAADPEPPGPSSNNLVINGGFEEFKSSDNLWDGVNSDGHLSGVNLLDPDVDRPSEHDLMGVQLLGRDGIAQTIVPVSVSLVDLNGDGLPDITTAWPSGYMFVYFNSGTRTEPKFTNAEMMPIFLSKGFSYTEDRQIHIKRSEMIRKAPRISFADWGGRGIMDLLVGNYQGEVLLIPNAGSATAPDFRQPQSIDSAAISVGRNRWGNLFAPAAFDMDLDKKPDLLLGEGSYSANAVQLLLNKGGGIAPKFTDEARFYLAYGDGREQLVPTLADYNGDGFIDVLSADREGMVSVHLNPQASWKPGEEFKFSTKVSFGGKDNLGGAVTISAGDYNGDGLFDLLIGRGNGRLSVAINRGTPQQPRFDVPLDIKGVNIEPLRFNVPGGRWNMERGFRNANAYAFFSCVGPQDDPAADPQEGQRVLKIGYVNCPNKVMKRPAVTFPEERIPWISKDSDDEYFGHWPNWYARSAFEPGFFAETGAFIVRQNSTRATQILSVGGTYELSFKVKGNAVKNAKWTVAYLGHVQLAPEKKTVGERGAVAKQYYIETEGNNETGAISAGARWSTVTRTFTVRFKKPELKQPGFIMSVLEFRCVLPGPDSVLYLDDVKLVRKN
jgi:hypothetical protein